MSGLGRLRPYRINTHVASWAWVQEPGASSFFDEENLGDSRDPLSGMSLLFDGTNDYVEIPHAADLNFGTNDFTVCALLKKTKTADFQVVVGKTSNATGGNFRCFIGADERLRLFYGTDAQSYTLSTLNVPANEWVLIAWGVSGANVAYYMHGSYETLPVTIQSLTSTESLRIGSDNSAASYRFGGRIDEVLIYDRALSKSELDEIRFGGVVGTPLRTFHFEESVGDIAYEAYGTGNHGTLNNGPVWTVDPGVRRSSANDDGYSDPDFVNGGFDNTDAWVLGSEWAISGGVATKTAGNVQPIMQAFPLIAGVPYTVSGTVSGRTDGILNMRTSNDSAGTVNAVGVAGPTANGPFSVAITPAAGNLYLGFNAGATFDGSIDDVSVSSDSGLIIPRDESDPANDVLGNPLDYNGKVPKPGIHRQSNCWLLDGNDDRILLTNDINESNLSISIWFNADVIGDMLFSNISSSIQYVQVITATTIRVRSDGTGGGSANFTVPTINTGAWNHVVITKNVDEYRCYLNGVESTSGALAFGPTLIVDSIGGYISPTLDWDGKLVDARFYDDVLTQDEVNYIHDKGASGSNPGLTNLICRLKMQEGSGTISYDSSPSGNHGTLVNGVSSDFQDIIHSNINDGFRISGAVRIPAKDDGIEAADGNPITNPSGAFHNGAETLIDFQSGEPDAPWCNEFVLLFNGTTDYVDAPVPLGSPSTYKLTAAFKTSSATDQTIIDSRDSGADGVHLFINSGVLSVKHGASTHSHTATGLNDDVWHLVEAEWDGTDVKITVDDVQETLPDSDPVSTTTNMRVGCRSFGISQLFSGQIADVTVEADGSKLIDWLFDDGGGLKTLDRSGNNNNGTLVGTPDWTLIKVVPDDYAFGDNPKATSPWFFKTVQSAVAENMFYVKQRGA